MRLLELRFPIFVVAALAAAAGAHAQAPHTQLTGVVLDASGGVVPDAAIELAVLDSRAAPRSTRSDNGGRYSFDAVAAGRYRLAVAFPGFEPWMKTDVTVGAAQTVTVDVVLVPARQEASVVVTAPDSRRPLVVETDPRAPRQPIPAHDGGDYLKAVPGFALVRKGGTDGDPVLRGMAGSRLGVLLDGQQILGGCGGRMDPPTAYVYPSAYDRITIVKGPESVLYVPGASAGVVLFERDVRRVARPLVKFGASQIAGGYGRHDEMVDVRAALPSFYVQAVGTRSQTGDYRDGNNATVHSAYMRWSGTAAAGWTPADDTRLEVSVASSDGRAAYADRTMDGVRFARENVAVKLDTAHPWWVVRRLEVQAYVNYVDHVMDNYSLRQPGAAFSVNNPDRATTGGRVAATVATTRHASVVVGVDTQRNIHTFRSGSSKESAEAARAGYISAPRVEDARFRQVGVFGEVTTALTQRDRVITGARADWHEAVDSRATVASVANDTKGARDHTALVSGFGRYERRVADSGTLYAGLGHAERSPDYWERLKQDPFTLKSAFVSTKPERTTQLDAGFLWKSGTWSASLSGFAGKVNDYILIRWSPTPTVTRNVDATTVGGEVQVSRRLLKGLRAEVTLAYVRSDNDTDHKPLALQPPIDGTFNLEYVHGRFSAGALGRIVGRQTRVDIGSGNIVANGMDLGPTAGFSVFSLNGSYRLRHALVLAVGVDNVLDRLYAEHISKGGAMVPGFTQTTRVNEPGRSFWMKLNVDVN